MKVAKVIEELTALADSLENEQKDSVISVVSYMKGGFGFQSEYNELTERRLRELIEHGKRVIYYSETALELLNTEEDE